MSYMVWDCLLVNQVKYQTYLLNKCKKKIELFTKFRNTNYFAYDLLNTRKLDLLVVFTSSYSFTILNFNMVISLEVVPLRTKLPYY